MKSVILCWAVLVGSSCVSIQAGTYVRFETVVGDVEVELYDNEKPATVRNFLNYARSGAYRNIFLHRCLPGFIVQSGGFAAANPQSSDFFGQYFHVPAGPPVTNEFAVGPKLSNTLGTLAMAKTADNPDSATSHWFFNLADNSSLLDKENGGFTVFGKVVSGMDTLLYFNTLNKANSTGIVDMRRWYPGNPEAEFFSDLPVWYFGNVPPRYNQLLYVDVWLVGLQVEVKPDGKREIKWNSVPDRVQHVEASSVPTQGWTALHTVTGNGEVLSFTDSTALGGARYYRIKVAF